MTAEDKKAEKVRFIFYIPYTQRADFFLYQQTVSPILVPLQRQGLFLCRNGFTLFVFSVRMREEYKSAYSRRSGLSLGQSGRRFVFCVTRGKENKHPMFLRRLVRTLTCGRMTVRLRRPKKVPPEIFSCRESFFSSRLVFPASHPCWAARPEGGNRVQKKVVEQCGRSGGRESDTARSAPR